jgi:uncharacterized protein with PQ loop repeat
MAWLVLVVTFFYKWPQFAKIHTDKSVAGISIMAYYSENIGCLHTASHAAHLGLSYLIYGEPLLIMIQNLAIIELIWKVDTLITIKEKSIYSLFVGFYGWFLFSGVVPEFAWSIITGTTIFFISLSRIPQIYGNY